ncbi:hypothetical protein MMC12_001644 [Toensbergia leucococca]|nr:hypothetical protein [Toensbergia leucococca]
MEAFRSHKRRKLSPPIQVEQQQPSCAANPEVEDESTNLKLATLLALPPTPPNDPLHHLPKTITSLLPTRPRSLLRLAYSKLHTYPFDSVPGCWLRLYEEASLYLAVGVIRRGIEEGEEGDEREDEDGVEDGGGDEWNNPEGEKENDWITHTVHILDKALIITGSPLRASLIHSLLSALESHSTTLHPQSPAVPSIPPHFPPSPLPHPKINHPIPRLQNPSLQSFQSHLDTPTGPTPLILTDTLSHWPALSTRPWSSPQYLLSRTFNGRRLVPVEVGKSYTHPEWSQKLVPFAEFVGTYLLRPPPPPPSAKTNNNNHRKEPEEKEDAKEQEHQIAYLAQHDLLSQIPALRPDIAIPDYCYTTPPTSPPLPHNQNQKQKQHPHLDSPLLNTWLGPAGTVSPLHTDAYHNLLCQVVGCKYVRLYDPRVVSAGRMFARGVEGGGVDMGNTSAVDDVEGLEGLESGEGLVGLEAGEGGFEERFPGFRALGFVEAVVGVGECLFVPRGWWHYVRGLSVSASVSFWWN